MKKGRNRVSSNLGFYHKKHEVFWKKARNDESLMQIMNTKKDFIEFMI